MAENVINSTKAHADANKRLGNPTRGMLADDERNGDTVPMCLHPALPCCDVAVL